MNNYEDIINLPHHTSNIHPRMSITNRAAQFAPFAALTGYSESVKEKARLTTKKIELDKELINNINVSLKLINQNIKNRPKVSITYFVQDEKKEGGTYKTIIDNVKRIDDIMKIIKMENNIIYLKDVLTIELIK